MVCTAGPRNRFYTLCGLHTELRHDIMGLCMSVHNVPNMTQEVHLGVQKVHSRHRDTPMCIVSTKLISYIVWHVFVYTSEHRNY